MYTFCPKLQEPILTLIHLFLRNLFNINQDHRLNLIEFDLIYPQDVVIVTQRILLCLELTF